MAKKILLTEKEIRFIWSLGFDTGRVQQSTEPNLGYSWDDELPLWCADLERLEDVMQNLGKRIRSAQQPMKPTDETGGLS